MSIAYFDGDFLPLDEVRVSPLDRGYLLGDGVYEVIPVYGGRLFRLQEHLDRLERSMAAIELGNPYARERWVKLLGELVSRNGAGEQSLYCQVTRGVAPRDHAFPEGVSPVVFAMTKVTGHRTQVRPATAITREDNRWGRCDIKSIALLPNCLHRQAAVQAGATEAILVRDGQVTEGSASNVFVVKDGCVITPPKSHRLLAGITRDVALELLHGDGVPLAERNVSVEELRDADEIWVTSSSLEISPVVALDGVPVSNAEPGPVWQRVDRSLQDFKRALMAA